MFLPVACLLSAMAGERLRWIILLIASLTFYSALMAPHLLAVLTLVTLITYLFGLSLDKAGCPKSRLRILWCGIAANFLILLLLKYLPFLFANMGALVRLFTNDVQIQTISPIMAIGVSYYIFQAISYLCDIYLDVAEPEKHLGYFALYLAYFPKLLQGPIERAGDLLPQLRKHYEFNYDNVRSGLLLFVWGLFKKVVIADRLGICVDAVYNDVHAYSGLPLVLATYAYGVQILMDFSGYTDMALGSAKLMNIELTQNFNTPYLATSIADFWRRWHISFSRWILDYIFRPLQMQLRYWKSVGAAIALMVTFVVSGVWHGASWCFVTWGGLHGLYMACSLFYKPYQKKIHKKLGLEKTGLLKWWQVTITFNLVCFNWVFFRANSIADGWYVATHLAAFDKIPATVRGFKDYVSRNVFMGQGKDSILILMVVFLVAILVKDVFEGRKRIENKVIRYTCYILVMLLCMNFGISKEVKFIYFDF